MKRREPLAKVTAKPARAASDGLSPLLEALLAMRTPGELRVLLLDLCTPAELEAMADRWRVVPMLLEAVPYREIHERTGVSVTTIGRIARCIEFGAGGYRLAAERLLAADSRHPH